VDVEFDADDEADSGETAAVSDVERGVRRVA